jgi:hypothetical protein
MQVIGLEVTIWLDLSRSKCIVGDDNVGVLENTFRSRWSSCRSALHGRMRDQLRRSTGVASFSDGTSTAERRCRT